MVRDCFSNPDSPKYKGGSNKEATTGSVEVLVASIEGNNNGADFLLSNVEQELEDTQGENVPEGIEIEVNNEEEIRGAGMQAVERSFVRAARYAEVQAVVLAYQLRQQLSVSDSQMPTLMGFSDADHPNGTESNVRILEQGPRNNNNDSGEDDDSYADMPGLVAREEDSTVVSNEDALSEESSLADFSHESTDVTSETESVTTEEGSIQSGNSLQSDDSSVIYIENLGDVNTETCFQCEGIGHKTHTWNRCMGTTVTPQQHEGLQALIEMAMTSLNAGQVQTAWLESTDAELQQLTNEQVLNEEESKGDEKHELGLVSQQAFPTHSLEILKNPNIWVGDTGATTNTCHNKDGCVNEKENNALSMGIEGKASKCHSEVDIPGIICDKYGNEVQEVTLRKCRYNPNANFNLLSLTKLLMDGLKMNGDNNAIVMRKGDCEIRFDIVIKTETGAIFAAYIKRRNAPELKGAW